MDTTDSAYGDKLIRLDTFDTAVAVDPSAEDDAKRRFMTLILQTAYRDSGNIGHVLRATNTSGEVFAVKLLKDNAILSGQAPDRSAEQSAAHLANTAALFEEYRHLCTVSHLRGFPRVYGYGSCEDDPLILMEWVEGTSLKQALPLLPHDASGGLTTQMVAAVGNAVLRALLMTQGLVNPVVHRDLSPANIMFRTTSRTLEQQIADCSFDPCLIDMGSATMALGDDTITRRADIWRFATPAYAAPEMLTQDIEGIAALRRSPAIDVYALSSILYQLYSGRKPFDVESTGAAATGSFYLIKTKTKPAPLEPRCEGDKALVQIIIKTTPKRGGLLLGYNPWISGTRLKAPAPTGFGPHCRLTRDGPVKPALFAPRPPIEGVLVLLDAQPVERDVGLLLLPDVLRDRRLVQADGGNVVALGPELPVAELVLHVRVPVEYHQRAFPLQIAHHAGHAVLRRYRQQHVDVVGHQVPLDDLYPLVLAELPEDLPKVGPYLVVDDFAPILRREHDVVLAHPLRVRQAVGLLGHTPPPPSRLGFLAA